VERESSVAASPARFPLLRYPYSWEDPAVDRLALNIRSTDDVVVITSGGCNVLDYLLAGARRVDAVDINPAQTAILELKLAAIRTLEHRDVFSLFGVGHLPDARSVYVARLRRHLSPTSQRYWDTRIALFEARRSFNFRGALGTAAWLFNLYTRHVAGLAAPFASLLASTTVDEQKAIFLETIRPRLWGRLPRLIFGRRALQRVLGLSGSAKTELEGQTQRGLVQFYFDAFDEVMCTVPLAQNYFWQVFFAGRYTPEACPEYLKEANFVRLRQLLDRVTVHTTSIVDFLTAHRRPVGCFVLLNQMDSLASGRGNARALLSRQWEHILRLAAPGARVIWRSTAPATPFVDDTLVKVDGATRRVGDMLSYRRALADRLHAMDRVHLYGGFHIADLNP
jgi:S-adenosylmethionine-diacylglycerol 3-amino-3-carboxypropyl transferase